MSDPISMRKASRKAIAIMDSIETQRRESVQAETVSEPTTAGHWTNEPPIPATGHAWHFTTRDPTDKLADREPRRVWADGWHGQNWWWWSVPIQEPPR